MSIESALAQYEYECWCNYNHEHIDENGNGRATYATFKKIAEGIWEYCGDCFRGENVKRGTELPYVR